MGTETKCSHTHRIMQPGYGEWDTPSIGLDGLCTQCGKPPDTHPVPQWKSVEMKQCTWYMCSTPPEDWCQDPDVIWPAEWSIDGVRRASIPDEPCMEVRESVGHRCTIPERVLVEYLQRRGYVVTKLPGWKKP